MQRAIPTYVFAVMILVIVCAYWTGLKTDQNKITSLASGILWHTTGVPQANGMLQKNGYPIGFLDANPAQQIPTNAAQ